MMDLRAVFFDLDGTLCDARPAWDAGEAAAFELLHERRPELDIDATRQVWAGVNERLFEALAKGSGDGGTTVRQVRDRRFGVLLRELGAGDAALAGELNDVLAEVRLANMRLFNDALPALQTLRARYHVGIVTNGAGDDEDDSQWSVLRHLGLLDLADSVWISDVVGFRKPDPRIFEGALEEVGVDPAQAAHVGDSLAADVAGANAAGLVSVWLRRPGRPPAPPEGPRPGLTVSSLEQLPQALQAQP